MAQAERSSELGAADSTPEMARASKLNWLFDHVRPPGSPKIPNRVVAEFVANETGESCSVEWIGALRRPKPGRRVRASPEKMAAIAKFFDVKPVYWYDDDAAAIIQASVNVVEAARDSRVRQVALRRAATAFLDNAEHMTLSNIQALTVLLQSFGESESADQSSNGDSPSVR